MNYQRIRSISFAILCLGIALGGCSSNKSDIKNGGENMSDAAQFESKLKFETDSAMHFIRHQVELGPRVPGTEAHRKCEEYIVRKMNIFGADTIIEQKGTVTAFTGDVLPFNNILARFNTSAPRRILLAAHYDTRPWADNETDEKHRKTPILGANDGGSGVGVLMELARIAGENDLPIGVDFLFVDVEDYGNSDGWGNADDTWCLGSQYWAQNHPYTIDELPDFGIVLDMVGGTNARFHREYYSDKTARSIVDKVWGAAKNIGLSEVFINELGGSIIDDHIQINKTGIPCIDIVECNNAVTRTFPPTWHTLHDNMAGIDSKSIKAVGTTVLNVIEKEAAK